MRFVNKKKINIFAKDGTELLSLLMVTVNLYSSL